MDAESLGRYLRETREARELSLEDAERALKIRRRVLQAFEDGQFELERLSAVQARGFMRNYVRYLGLDIDKMMGYHAAVLKELHDPTPNRRKNKKKKQSDKQNQDNGQRSTSELPAAKKDVTDTDPTLPPVPVEEHVSLGDTVENRRMRRRNSLSRTVIFLVALAALSVVAFVVYEVLTRPASAIVMDSVPQIIVTETTTPTFTPLPTSTSAQQAAQPTERSYLVHTYTGEGAHVSILTQQRTWLLFTVDGEERYSGMAPPGAEIEARGDQIELTASNAEALLVTYNGEPQRLLGQRGQRVDVVFTEERMDVSSGLTFEPTAEGTATPLPTSEVDVGALIEAQTPSNTPGPSPTPSDTPVPSNTPTITPTPTQTLTPSLTPTTTPTVGPSPTPTNTPTDTLTPTATLTLTPSDTPVPTATFTPSPVLPLRETPADVTPTKDGA